MSDRQTTRVVYSIGRLPELVTQFACGMRARLGWEPVYWITQPELENEVAHCFPEAVRHPFSDANRGLPASGLEWTMSAPLGADDLARALPFEARALEIIDRHVLANGMDSGERRALYHRMLAWALAVVDTFEIDLFVVASTPHVIADFCLYVACEARGAGVRMHHMTGFAGRQLILHDIDAPPAGLGPAFEELSRAPAPPALGSEGETQLARGSDPQRFTVPWYVERQQEKEGKLAHLQKAADFVIDHGLAGWEGVRFDRPVEVPAEALGGRKLGVPAERPGMVNVFRRVIGEKHRTTPLIRSFARPGVPLSGRRITWGEYYTYRDWALLRKTAFRRSYDALSVAPGDAELADWRFVYFPLHYQPERTTCPDGGVFNDQYLVASLLAHALPEGWKLLVKEHPSQFIWPTEGELGRWDGYYDRFLDLPNTLLVSTGLASDRLILGAGAVATVTGMAGWEALMLGRPVLAFGNAWYAECPGASRVSTLEEVRDALARAAAGEGPDAGLTRRFAAAIEAVSERCYVNPSHAANYPELDEQTNCAALCALFAKAERLIAAAREGGEACASPR